jgi:PAS domain S-box-containing protein
LTELKKTERALRKSEARLRQAQQQARLAYWNWRFDAEEYQWAPGSGLILGLPDEALPKAEADYYATIHPDDRERMSRLYDDVKAGLEHYTAEFRILRPDGTVRWMREIGEVEHDAGGRRISVAGTIQDITGQRAIEEQLQQAQKMEAVGQLTGGIAHDFNNLLAIILGNLELLRAALSQDLKAQERIDTAIRASLRGSDLTHRLLAFARQQPLAPKATQIDDLIRSMRDLLLRPLGPTIDVEFAMGEDLWPTQIDQAQLETSLLNLVINARDAMPDGGKLTVATANIAVGLEEANQIEGLVPGDYVVISVSDTGGGMTDEVRTRAFDPFFTTKGVGKGTGLGLSMVYGFVKQSGGHIELHSAVGLGTTVKIWLPRAKGAAGPTAAGPEANEARGRETILIVEDEPGILALVADHLKGLGYSVVAALDGPAALAAIAEHREIDLLLTDIVLPGPLNGRAVAGQACAMRPKLKVVYMSGYAPNSAVPGGRLDPGVRHIVKPFRKVDLARMVREALDERDAG